MMKSFYKAIGDDLNVSAALAVLFNLQREANKLADNGELTRRRGKKYWRCSASLIRYLTRWKLS